MANMQINQYGAASTIDAINDYLLIDPGGTGIYKKINRNTALGITGSPVGTTDTQTLSNKIIGSTNAITALDSNFTIQDNGDNTKQAQFQLASNTTGTTRIYTMPNASVTLASLTGTETLTNKTITGATISGGTIDNSTITVDSIAGHTTSTVVTIANLQISNGVLNSSNAVTATSIAVGAVQPQALVSGTGSGWSWQSWSPTYVNLTVGNGTVIAKYNQTGKTVNFYYQLAWGSTTTFSASSNLTISLPVTASSDYLALASLGPAQFSTSGGGNISPAVTVLSSSTTFAALALNSASTYIGGAQVNNTSPFTWGANYVFYLQGTYQAA